MRIHNNSRLTGWIGTVLGILFLLPGAGCIRFTSNTTPQSVVFETTTGGDAWQARDAVWTITEPAALRSLKPNVAIIHPRTPQSLYLSIDGNGLYNYIANAWLKLPDARVPRALTIDPDRTCTLYASFNDTMDKSIDCGRSWSILFQNAPNTVITALTIPPSNAARILMGSNQGDIFLSTNYGQVWTSPLRAESPIAAIIVNPKHNDEIYVFTKSNQLYRSNDAGVNWTDLSSGLEDYGSEWRAASISFSTDGTLYVATNQQLLRSDDRGLHWKALPLLTSPDTTDIRSFVIDPQDERAMYYATTTTFYRSADYGQQWQALPLPSAYPAHTILIDPKIHGHLYLIVTST